MKYKVIITGPVGSGKTTAINALTDEKALKTDVPVSDMTTSQRKQTTTVALDYGVIKLTDEDVAHVYGTPGQERFDFMWEIISEGANGLVLLLDNCRNYPFRDLIYFTNQFHSLIEDVPFIIGVTRSDIKDDPSIETYRQWLTELNINAAVLMVDARNKEHIHQLVRAMLYEESASADAVPKIANIETEDKFLNSESGETSDNNFIGANTENKTEAKTETPTETWNTTVSHKINPSHELEKVQEAKTTEPKKEALSYSSKILLTEKSMSAVAKINGVTGVSLTNDMGELMDTTVFDDDMNEFIAFLSGITPSIQEAAGLGEIHRIMLRGANDDNLTVFVEDERSLGVTSLQKTSVPALSQQIEDMLQWI